MTLLDGPHAAEGGPDIAAAISADTGVPKEFVTAGAHEAAAADAHRAASEALVSGLASNVPEPPYPTIGEPTLPPSASGEAPLMPAEAPPTTPEPAVQPDHWPQPRQEEPRDPIMGVDAPLPAIPAEAPPLPAAPPAEPTVPPGFNPMEVTGPLPGPTEDARRENMMAPSSPLPGIETAGPGPDAVPPASSEPPAEYNQVVADLQSLGRFDAETLNNPEMKQQLAAKLSRALAALLGGK